MGGLTWLQTLGLALGTGLIGTLFWSIRQVLKGNLVPRVTLEREREISNQWRTIAETYAENDRKRSEIVTRNNEILGRVLVVLERAPWLGIVPGAGLPGSPGSDGSDGNRQRQTELR